MKKGWPLIKMSIAATRDGVSVMYEKPPVAGSRPRRIWVVDTHK